MSITEVNPTWAQESVDQQKDGNLRVTVGYQVIADAPFSSILEILADPRLPQYGDPHPELSGLIVLGRRANRNDETRNVATAEITYSSQVSSSESEDPENPQEQQDKSPLDFRPRIEWHPVENTAVATFGKLVTGGVPGVLEPISNSAGVPYWDPPPEMRQTEWQILYQRNETVPNPDSLDAIDVLNEEAFTIDGVQIEARKALMLAPTILSLEVKNGIAYRPVTYDIRIRPKRTRTGTLVFQGWELELQDRGFQYLDAGDLKDIPNEEGEPVTEPAFLDGSGGIATSPGVSPARVYEIYTTKSFSVFNFQ